MSDVIASPVFVFALALAVAAAIAAFARRYAPAPPDAGDKTMPYVGGEPFKAAVVHPGYGFFTVALFFTLVHVAALVLATVPGRVDAWIPLSYLALVGVAVIALRWER